MNPKKKEQRKGNKKIGNTKQQMNRSKEQKGTKEDASQSDTFKYARGSPVILNFCDFYLETFQGGQSS